MDNFQKIFTLTFGSSDIITIACGFFMGTVGIFFNLLIQANKRNVFSEKSPIGYSYRYMLKDNYKNIVISYFFFYLLSRFGITVFTGLDLVKLFNLSQFTPDTANMFLAFIYGLVSHLGPKYIILLIDKISPKKK